MFNIRECEAKRTIIYIKIIKYQLYIIIFYFEEIANHLTDQCIPILLKILSYLPGLSNIDVEGN